MLRDATNGVKPIYPEPADSDQSPTFTQPQLEQYKSAMDRVRKAVAREFGLERLWFTAPTFITRSVGTESWAPKEIHDEYWHPHVDKQNTAHYDYSGLVYLKTHGDDFTGGLFSFLDRDDNGTLHSLTVAPRAGRLVSFSSGAENLHQGQRVHTGARYVLSLWFTCDPAREFTSFLDGKVHKTFSTGATDGAVGETVQAAAGSKAEL